MGAGRSLVRSRSDSLGSGSGSDTHPNVPDTARNVLVIVFGEFCGTFMFLLVSFLGTQAALFTNQPGDDEAPLRPYSLLYIASSFGCALAINVWVFYRVTGGMFNPAVTLGLVLVGAVPPIRALYIVPTQLVAAIAAAGATSGMLPGPLLVANHLGGGTTVANGLGLECFLTAQLVLTVYFLAVEKHRGTFLAPVGIGIAVFVAHIAGTNFTGTGINPARTLGPAVVEAAQGGNGFPGYSWIYWVGPFLGALLAFAIYKALKWLEFEKVNPGQDAKADVDLEKAREGKDRQMTPINGGSSSIGQLGSDITRTGRASHSS